MRLTQVNPRREKAALQHALGRARHCRNLSAAAIQLAVAAY
jgi:hypothetical protein